MHVYMYTSSIYNRHIIMLYIYIYTYRLDRCASLKDTVEAVLDVLTQSQKDHGYKSCCLQNCCARLQYHPSVDGQNLENHLESIQKL